MQIMTPADRATLKRLVGASTFARGRRYAHQGAVKSYEWHEDGVQVHGEVQGAAARPYTTSVVLSRSLSKRLAAVDATCTCPVGVNCKHAVALLLSEDVSTPGPSSRNEPGRPVDASDPGAHSEPSGRSSHRDVMGMGAPHRGW